MKKIIKMFPLVILAMMFMFLAQGAFALQRIEDDNLSVTSMRPTEYVLYTLSGSTGSTSVYYKVTAFVVGGVGEINPASLTVTDANAVRSSTNTLLVRWAPVIGASSYNVYRSTVSSSTYFYLLGNVAKGTLSLLDYGQAAGAAYSAPSPRGGSLEVENDAAIGDDLTVAGDATITGTLTASAGVAMAGAQTVTAATITVSTSATSTLGMCFAGAFQSLPTTGYAEGCMAYQNSDNKVYVATETVTVAGSWVAIH